jgi:hypothetical protein
MMHTLRMVELPRNSLRVWAMLLFAAAWLRLRHEAVNRKEAWRYFVF